MEDIFKKVLCHLTLEDIEEILDEFEFPKSKKKDDLIEIILKNATVFEYAVDYLFEVSSKSEIQILCDDLDIDSKSKVGELKKKILDKLNKNIENRNIENKIQFLSSSSAFHKEDLEEILDYHEMSSTGKKERLVENIARNDFLVVQAMIEWKKELQKDDIKKMCDSLDIDSEGNRENLLERINDYVFKNEVKIDIQNESTTNKTNSTKHVGKISEEDLENDFKKYNPFEMEYIVGALFESKGYEIKVTPSTGDFGIDVWATKDNEKIAIQVKHQEKDVGYDTIVKTVGATIAQVNRVIVVSTKSGFTKQTLEYQMEYQNYVHLWNTAKFKKELREHLI